MIILRRIHGLTARERRNLIIVLLLFIVPTITTIALSMYLNNPMPHQ